MTTQNVSSAPLRWLQHFNTDFTESMREMAGFPLLQARDTLLHLDACDLEKNVQATQQWLAAQTRTVRGPLPTPALDKSPVLRGLSSGQLTGAASFGRAAYNLAALAHLLPQVAHRIVAAGCSLVGALVGALGAVVAGERGREWGSNLMLAAMHPVSAAFAAPAFAVALVGFGATMLGVSFGVVCGAFVEVVAACAEEFDVPLRALLGG